MSRLLSLLLTTTLASSALAQEPEGTTEAPAAEAQAVEAPVVPATTTYSLSASRSDVYVVIRNDTSASLQRLGHDHVIYASNFTGTAVWPNRPGEACKVDFSVPVAKLTVDPPGLREKAGIDPDNTISDSDKGKLSSNMWGKSQLHSAGFSTISFSATSCEGTSGKVKVNGNMTIRGVTKPVSLTMDVSADGKSFSASGRLESSHTAFGFKPFSASFVGPRNQDRLTFVIRARGSAM